MAVRVNSAFANASMPDRTTVNFGNYLYTSGSFNPNSNRIEIDANVVFGKLRVVEGGS